MNLHISKRDTLRDIQQGFQKLFPYLKIEFFRPKSGPDTYTANDLLDPSIRIGEVTGDKEYRSFQIEPDMKVSSFEKKFNEIFGLHLEVFRKSGKIWLKTSVTDHWTLQEQNREAEDSESKKTDKTEETDYHEQE